MTDAHMRILRLVAQQRRRHLDEHDAHARSGKLGSGGGRRRYLERAATRTGAQLTQAEARRSHGPPIEGSSSCGDSVLAVEDGDPAVAVGGRTRSSAAEDGTATRGADPTHRESKLETQAISQPCEAISRGAPPADSRTATSRTVTSSAAEEPARRTAGSRIGRPTFGKGQRYADLLQVAALRTAEARHARECIVARGTRSLVAGI